MTRNSLALVASTVTFMAFTVQAVEVRLERKVAQVDQLKTISPAIAQGQPKPGERLTTEPNYTSDRPVYFAVTLGSGDDTTRTVALDESGGTGKGYDTLYVDRNNNEDLTDDGQLTGTVDDVGGLCDGEFPAVDVELACGNKTVPCALKLTYFSNPGDGASAPTVFLRVVTSHYCEGQVNLGALRAKIAVMDSTCNGLFNDRFAPTPQTEGQAPAPQPGDTVLIDLNGDGEYNTKPGSREMRRVARYLQIGHRFYEMRSTPDGSALAIEEATPELGTIRSAGGGFYVALQSGDGMLEVWTDESSTQVPVGKHRVHACAQQKRDREGSLWRIQGKSGGNIEVAKGSTVDLQFGAPLKIEIAGTGNRGPELTPGSTVAFDLSITGKGGETYPATQITREGEPPAQPSFKIRSPSGESVASGKFEYG